MTKKRGIVDPWRKDEPLRAPPPQPVVPAQPGERIDVEDIDMDADLAIPGRHVIRSEHAAFDVVSVEVRAPGDALRLLVECIEELAKIPPVRTALEGAGIGTSAWNTPPSDMPASTLKCERAALFFIQKPLDQGMLVLARILRAPEAAAILHKRRITVMMTG